MVKGTGSTVLKQMCLYSTFSGFLDQNFCFCLCSPCFPHGVPLGSPVSFPFLKNLPVGNLAILNLLLNVIECANMCACCLVKDWSTIQDVFLYCAKYSQDRLHKDRIYYRNDS